MSGATSAVLIGAAVVGAATSAYGAISAGNAQAAAASQQATQQRFQAQVAQNQAQVMENNAIVAEQNADYAGKVGMENASRESMKGAARMGKIKAAIAANGVDPNSGSAVDVEQSQREISKLDSLQVMSDAELKAYGYRSDAVNARYAAASLRAGANMSYTSAGFSDSAASSASTGGYLKAGGTLLSSLSSLPTKWSSGGSGISPQAGGFNFPGAGENNGVMNGV